MFLPDFLRQVRGTNADQDFPPDFLDGIFTRVSMREFKLPASPSMDLRMQTSRAGNGLLGFWKPADKPGGRFLAPTTSLRASEAGLEPRGALRIPQAIPSGRAMYTDDHPPGPALTGENEGVAEKPAGGNRDPADALLKASKRSICCCFSAG